MPAHAGEHYTVALQGFSDFERGALRSFFRLAAERAPAYVQVDDLDRCDFVIADADQAASLQAVTDAGRTGDTVFVGAHAPPRAMAWLPRPIDPMHILRELDSLAEQRHSSPGELRSALADVSWNEPVPSRFGSSFGDLDQSGPDVLVAEDSAVARRFLQVKLQQLGYRVHLAGSGDEAITMLQQEHFDIAFLDVVLGPPGSVDGLGVCQQVKHDPAFAGKVPKVVLVTGLSGPTDRVRGTLAGCDAYITKPVDEALLFKVLAEFDAGFSQRNPSALRRRG